MHSNCSQPQTRSSDTKSAICSMAITTLMCCPGLSGCATPVTRQVAWYPVGNMSETCARRQPVISNGSGCVEVSVTGCIVWTKNRSVSYEDFGALMRRCYGGVKP